MPHILGHIEERFGFTAPVVPPQDTSVVTGEALAPVTGTVAEPQTEVTLPGTEGLDKLREEVKEEEKPPEPVSTFEEQLSRLTADPETPEKRAQEIAVRTQVEQRRLTELTKKAQLLEIRASEAQEKALKSGETLGFARGEAAVVRREALFETLRANAEVQAAQGNLSLARQLAGEAVDTKFAQEKQDIETARNNILANFDTFTAKEKKRALATLARLDSEDAFVEEQKAREKAKEDVLLEFAGKVDNEILDEAKLAPDAISAKAILQAALPEPITPSAPFTLGKGQIRFDAAGKVIARGIVESPSVIPSGEFANVVSAISSAVSAEKGTQRGKDVASGIAQAIENKDFTSAYSQVLNGVEATLSGTNQTRFESARIDFQVMSGMREAIQAYVDGGGELGVLKGKAEEISRKLGVLTTDPKFGALAVQLQREFQTYRNIMTGAAFTPAESREYESVNPTLGKRLDLNLAIIEGALNQLENRIVGTAESKAPGSRALFERSIGAVEEDVDPATAAIGTIIEIGGVQYKKVGEDQFEEI